MSTAGLRAGLAEGTRTGLWSYYAAAIDALKPKLVVIENVRGLLSAEAARDMGPSPETVGYGPDGAVLRAAGAVLGDLAELGYDASWRTVPASWFGAPHRRERVFILAWPRGRDPGYVLGHVRQVVSEPDTNGRVVTLPTPRAAQDDPRNSAVWLRENGPQNLENALAHVLPTPRATRGGSSTETVGALLPTLSTSTPARRGGDRSDELLLLGVVPGALLPTPAASEIHAVRTNDQAGGWTLSYTVGEMFPTPSLSDTKTPGVAGARAAAGHMVNLADLADAVEGLKLFPTPMTMDAGRGKDPADVTRYAGTGQPFVQLNDLATVYGEPVWRQYTAAIARWEAAFRPAPYPVVATEKSKRPQLSPEFDEWMMGWPAGWTDVPGLTGDGRRARLRICGNGVVPQQAAGALRMLLADMAEELSVNMMREIRTALDDVRAGVQNANNPGSRRTTTETTKGLAQDARQLDLLRKMMDAPPDRPQPWSHYQPRVLEEFGE